MQFSKKICPVCHTFNLIPFISFGQMPVANAFLKKEDLEKPEFTYEMGVGFCENCKMVQMINIVPYEKYIVPDTNGKTNYAFFSSTSKFMENHFAGMAKEIEEKFLKTNSKVMDIGSNDGIFLKAFNNHRVLGIEPSHNVAEIAKKQGIETLTNFFSTDLARLIVAERGKFKAIFSANVILNIIDIHDLFNGVNHLLEDDGVFIMENPYIKDILKETSYDQIYDEHIWFFSVLSTQNLLDMHNMEVFDAERLWVHGGSLRVYACKKGARPKTERLKKMIEEETSEKIDKLESYLAFANRVENSKIKLKKLLIELKAQNKKVVGYAAASKGTIVLNYCGIGKETLDYIADSTPFKQGLFSPGKHIPVVSPEKFREDTKVDYVLLGAWNHAKEIIKKEKDFIDRGGKFIVHYPEARILDPREFEISFEKKERIKTHADTSQKSELIEGVEIKKLNVFANDQGYLFETLRNDDQFFGGAFGQVLISNVYPGVIKGFHLHHKHDEYITCLNGNLKYIIVKENPDGTKKINTFVIGERNPMLIKVPREVWRGYMPLENKSAMVMDIMSRPYDSKDPDTEEKDVFAFGNIWTPKNG